MSLTTINAKKYHTVKNIYLYHKTKNQHDNQSFRELEDSI